MAAVGPSMCHRRIDGTDRWDGSMGRRMEQFAMKQESAVCTVQCGRQLSLGTPRTTGAFVCACVNQHTVCNKHATRHKYLRLLEAPPLSLCAGACLCALCVSLCDNVLATHPKSLSELPLPSRSVPSKQSSASSFARGVFSRFPSSSERWHDSWHHGTATLASSDSETGC